MKKKQYPEKQYI